MGFTKTKEAGTQSVLPDPDGDAGQSGSSIIVLYMLYFHYYRYWVFPFALLGSLIFVFDFSLFTLTGVRNKFVIYIYIYIERERERERERGQPKTPTIKFRALWVSYEVLSPELSPALDQQLGLINKLNNTLYM